MPGPFPWTLQMKSHGRRPEGPSVCLCGWHQEAPMKTNTIQWALVLGESGQWDHWKSETGLKRTRHLVGRNGPDSTVPFVPFVLGFHGTLLAPGLRRGRGWRQARDASSHLHSLPVQWGWGGGKEGDCGRLALGEAYFGHEMPLAVIPGSTFLSAAIALPEEWGGPPSCPSGSSEAVGILSAGGPLQREVKVVCSHQMKHTCRPSFGCLP